MAKFRKMSSSVCNRIFLHKNAIFAAAYVSGMLTALTFACDVDGPNYAHVAADEAPQEFVTVAFAFYGETEPRIYDVTGLKEASVSIGQSQLNPLKRIELHQVTNVMVVEAEVLKGYYLHFDIGFVDTSGQSVGNLRVQLESDQTATFHGMVFQSEGQEEIVVYHNQPPEVHLKPGEEITLPLEQKNQIWFDGQFHPVWRIIEKTPGSEIEVLADTDADPLDGELLELDNPAVGFSSESATKGDTVVLKAVLP